MIGKLLWQNMDFLYPLTAAARRDPEGRELSSLRSLLPLLSCFLVRFIELAKMEKEAKGDSGTSGPSTRISLSNRSQTKIPRGTAGCRTLPYKRQGTLTLFYFPTRWVSFLSPNGQTHFSHLTKWLLDPPSCSGQKFWSQKSSLTSHAIIHQQILCPLPSNTNAHFSHSNCGHSRQTPTIHRLDYALAPCTIALLQPCSLQPISHTAARGIL